MDTEEIIDNDENEEQIGYTDTRTAEEWLEYSTQTSNGRAVGCEDTEQPRSLWMRIFAVFIFIFKLCWAALMLGVIALACVAFFYWAILMIFVGIGIAESGKDKGISGATFFLPLRLAKIAWNAIW